MNKMIHIIAVLICTAVFYSCSQSSYSDIVPIDDNLHDIASSINGASISFEQDHQ